MTERLGVSPATRSAFTLVELLVVVAILALLIGLTVTVGTKMTNSSRASATANTIRVLDNSLAEWIASEGQIPASQLPPPTGIQGRASIPLVDGRTDGAKEDDPANPTVTLYTAMVMQSAAVAPALQSLDTKYAKPTVVDFGVSGAPTAYKALSVVDAWERPIRFVHPAYHGGYGDFFNDKNVKVSRANMSVKVDGTPLSVAFRRSYRPWSATDPQRTSKWVGDADEGICPGGRPYFYSAGQDGDPGTRSDNVYTVESQYPAETARFK